MSSSIIDTIMLSEKRKDIMLLLSSSSKSRREIADSLGVSWNLLKQPLKDLKDAGMVFQEDENFRLSNNGQLMIKALMPLLNMVNTFSSDSNYWINRDLQAIPLYIAKRMGEVSDSSLVTLPMDYMFEPLKQFLETTVEPRYLHIVLSLFDPEAPMILSELLKKGVQISLVFKEQIYNKMNENFGEQLQKLLASENISFYELESEINPPELMITDKEMAVIFFNQDGKYDYRELRSSDERAIKWANDLFDYYKVISEPVI
jgi:predicted transcriptional regulator